MHLRLGRASADGPPRAQVGEELRRNDICARKRTARAPVWSVLTQELARSGNAHLGQVKQEFARELETPVDLVSAVHVGVCKYECVPHVARI